jgi:pimeloyl-ACP methyl ester carboxylesterase
MTDTETRSRPQPATDLAAVHTTPADQGGHIGRIVTMTMVGGLLAAALAVTVPFAGAEEHVITGSVLVVFSMAWAALASLSTRRTGEPQRWAIVPAVAMATAGLSNLVLGPAGNELGWVWPPAMAALVAWMVVRSRHAMRSRARLFVLYPVFSALGLSAVGGAYETYRETTDPSASSMPGRLVDVGGHKLHIDCTGSGSPTVVLEPGMGEVSAAMSGWIAPAVATTTRVCVYDRAGRGWSEAASHAPDGDDTATDLHTLLQRAGEAGPYVLAGHSAGGIYVMDFARLYPNEVAGVVLLDSMHPEQYTRVAGWPAVYESLRRAYAVFPSLSRLGLGRLINATSYSDLPAQARNQERAFQSAPRGLRSTRDEFAEIRAAMAQAHRLTTLGDRPLVVLTAQKDAQGGWAEAQDNLATLSSNSVHRLLPHASHAALSETPDGARESTGAIHDVVEAVRTNTALTAERR